MVKKLKYSIQISSHTVRQLQFGVLNLLIYLKKKGLLYNTNKIYWNLVGSDLKKKKFTILKSPFVNKSARDQLEIRTFSLLLNLKIVNPENSQEHFYDNLFKNLNGLFSFLNISVKKEVLFIS